MVEAQEVTLAPLQQGAMLTTDVGGNKGGEQQGRGREGAGCLPLRIEKSLPQVVGSDMRVDTRMGGSHWIRPVGLMPAGIIKF